jgi:hypothetical protein
MNQENLDFIRGKESPWTGMFSVTERNVLIARGNKLVLAFVARLHAHVVETMTIKFQCVWVNLFICHGSDRYTEAGILGDPGTIL